MPGMLPVRMPGTWSWPMTWARSSGTPYFVARCFTSAAELSYIDSVYQVAPVAAKPSCSIPTECMLTYQLPAWNPTFFGLTCCATWPSEERTV